MHSPLMPGANRSQWFQANWPGSSLTPNCIVLHTTEGSSWPSYGGGSMAPNFTLMPVVADQKVYVRQHFPANVSSRALVNLAGGVETNTAGAVQYELVGTCAQGGPGLYWPDAPDWALQGVADALRWLHDEWGVPLVSTPRPWLAYPASYGNSVARMSFAEWRAFVGICGHQHVPENLHGDPGAFPIGRLLELTGTTNTPTPQEAPMTPQDLAAIQQAITEALRVNRRPQTDDLVNTYKLRRLDGTLVVWPQAMQEMYTWWLQQQPPAPPPPPPSAGPAKS